MPEQPTYSFSEIMYMLSVIQNDSEGLNLIAQLVNEEKRLYCLKDLEMMKFYHDILRLNAKQRKRY